MEKIAVLSDIHGNAKALENALHSIKEKGIDSNFICRDIVGYGKNPNECCDMVRTASLIAETVSINIFSGRTF
jgi:Icc-related predicted phosphoesterase